MNPVEILVKQTEDAYGWTNKLLDTIPHNKWDNTPDIIQSNISWQAGHLLMSFYFHSIMVVAGHQKDILQKVPLKEYDKLFTDAEPARAVGKTNPYELQSHLLMVERKSIEVIRSLSPEDLESPLHPSPTPHPIARTKFEAIDWNIKHTMWHCGQIGILKRIVDKRFNFGLKRD